MSIAVTMAIFSESGFLLTAILTHSEYTNTIGLSCDVRRNVSKRFALYCEVGLLLAKSIPPLAFECKVQKERFSPIKTLPLKLPSTLRRTPAHLLSWWKTQVYISTRIYFQSFTFTVYKHDNSTSIIRQIIINSSVLNSTEL